jgi:small subunit ribosomal protein S8
VKEEAVAVADPVADMLTRIRNAIERRREEVEMPSSKLLEAIARILKEEGYIEDYQVDREGSYPVLKLRLKYLKQGTRTWRSAIQGLRRVSRPARRIYVKAAQVRDTHSGLGISILSTSQGIMTGRQARKQGVGGEIICEIW